MRMNLFSNVSFTPSKGKDSALTAPWAVAIRVQIGPRTLALIAMLTRLAASSTNHFAIATLIAL